MTATKSKPIPAKLDRPRKVRTPGDDDLTANLILPEHPAIPKPVAVAAAEAREAWRLYAEAKAARVEAAEDVNAAPAHDQAQDAAALAAGKDMPERSEPAKRQVLADANRREKAAAENLRAALHRQADAIREHYGDWHADQEARVVERAEATRKLLVKAEQEFDALLTDRALLDAIRGFNGQPLNWIYTTPNPARRQRRRDEAAKPTPQRTVERDLDALLGALRVEAGRLGA